MSIEQDIAAWHCRKFPEFYPNGVLDDRLMAAKLNEEAGEVAGAAIKMVEGRKTLDDLYNEMGDALTCLSVQAAKYGWTLGEILEDKWAEIR